LSHELSIAAIACDWLRSEFRLQPSLRWRARFNSADEHLCSKKLRLQVDSDSVVGGFEAGEERPGPFAGSDSLSKHAFWLFCSDRPGDGTIVPVEADGIEAHSVLPLTLEWLTDAGRLAKKRSI